MSAGRSLRPDAFTIGELSRRSGAGIQTIRYYERIDLLPAPNRTASGQRVYALEDLEILLFIRRARALNFSLQEIRALLDENARGRASCNEIQRITARHLASIRSTIAHLVRLERLLANALTGCSVQAEAGCPVLDLLTDGVEVAALLENTVHGQRHSPS